MNLPEAENLSGKFVSFRGRRFWWDGFDRRSSGVGACGWTWNGWTQGGRSDSTRHRSLLEYPCGRGERGAEQKLQTPIFRGRGRGRRTRTKVEEESSVHAQGRGRLTVRGSVHTMDGPTSMPASSPITRQTVGKTFISRQQLPWRGGDCAGERDYLGFCAPFPRALDGESGWATATGAAWFAIAAECAASGPGGGIRSCEPVFRPEPSCDLPQLNRRLPDRFCRHLNQRRCRRGKARRWCRRLVSRNSSSKEGCFATAVTTVAPCCVCAKRSFSTRRARWPSRRSP